MRQVYLAARRRLAGTNGVNRTDRLTGILLALRGGRQTAARLAARFGVSRRTILRDLDALGEIGVPVIAVAGAGGGFELADGFWLPPLHLTSEETTLLLLALNTLGPAERSPFGVARRTVEEKLRAALRPEIAREAEEALQTLSVESTEPAVSEDHLRALRNAVRRGIWLRIAYRSVRRRADHLLQPRRLYLSNGRWYCAAFSLAAREERVFRLDRMEEIEPVPPPPGAAEALRSVRSGLPYDDPTHPEVVVRLSEAGLVRAEVESALVRTAVRLAGGEWEARFRCPPSELPYYASVVFALGPEAAALAPADLRALVRELALGTLHRLESTADADEGDRVVSPIPSYRDSGRRDEATS
jgi:predicted DNA-binding transcriptional regulator YafY